jgi:hypothetical protein
VVRVHAGTKHWHEAKADSWFCHVAFITAGDDVRNEWLVPTTDETHAHLRNRARPMSVLTTAPQTQ